MVEQLGVRVVSRRQLQQQLVEIEAAQECCGGSARCQPSALSAAVSCGASPRPLHDSSSGWNGCSAREARRVLRAPRARIPSCGRSRARRPRRSGCCHETGAGAARSRASAAPGAPRGSFESQLAQRARIVRPVLAHLDPERQMKAAAEQAIELQARGAADALEARAVGADDDRLVAGAIDPDDRRRLPGDRLAASRCCSISTAMPYGSSSTSSSVSFSRMISAMRKLGAAVGQLGRPETSPGPPAAPRRSRACRSSRLLPLRAEIGTMARNSCRVRQLLEIRQQPLARPHAVDLVDHCYGSAAAVANTRRAPARPLRSTCSASSSSSTMSASPSAAAAVRFIARLSARRCPRCSPGVSTKAICARGSCSRPIRRWRVVCGRGVTMLSFCPTSAFSSVDLPTLGRPASATKPLRNSVFARSGSARAPARLRPARRAAGSSPRRRRAPPWLDLAGDAKQLRVQLTLDAFDHGSAAAAGRATAAAPAAASSGP